jgi:hypothetical protein
MTHRQQQQFPAFTSGRADSTPMNNPPQNAGCSLSFTKSPASLWGSKVLGF